MRPRLKEIFDGIRNESLSFSEVDIFSKVTAGMGHMLFSYIDKRLEALLPDSANKQDLVRWAKMLGVQITENEDDEALRFKVLDHLRRPPHGGCKWDFERWATITEVSKAFVFPTYPSLGSVGIACIDKDLNIINENSELSKKIIQSVEEKKPITCKVQYVQLTEKKVKLNILSSMDATRSIASVSDFFKNHAPGGDEPEIQLSTIHRILIESGLRDYELIEPFKKITLEKIEVPRLLEAPRND